MQKETQHSLQTGLIQQTSTMRMRTCVLRWQSLCVSGWRGELTASVATWHARFRSSSGRRPLLNFVQIIRECTCLLKVRNLNFTRSQILTLHMHGNFTTCSTRSLVERKTSLNSLHISKRMLQTTLQMRSVLCSHQIMTRTHGRVPSSREWVTLQDLWQCLHSRFLMASL